MLQLESVTLRVAGKILLDKASLQLPENTKVGFVGPNGSGKSSLFKALLSDLSFETGNFYLPKNTTIATIEQEILELELPVLQYVLNANNEQQSLLEETKTASDPDRIAQIHERLIALDAYSAQSQAAQILSGIGFSNEMQQKPLKFFSNGWRMRANLAKLLFLKPNLLLLDEPTNYLDLEGNIWLIDYLKRYPYNAFMISHDQELLNNTADAIVHLDEKKLTFWKGNYRQFLIQHEQKIQIQEKKIEKQNKERESLEKFISRFKAKASKAKQAQSRIKMLEKLEDISSYQAYKAQKFSFERAQKKLNATIIKFENVAFEYEKNKPLFKKLIFTIEYDDRIALLGINGSGKSSLTKLLTGELSPQKGIIYRHPNLSIGLFSQDEVEKLPFNETVYEYVSSFFPDFQESFIRSKIAQIGLSTEKMDTRIQYLSGGEKTRLVLGLIGLKGVNCLILDEPTNHLDIESSVELIKTVNNFEGAVIVICHDQNFIKMTMDQLWVIHQKNISPFSGDVNDYKKFILSNRSQEPLKTKEPKADLQKNLNQEKKKLEKEIQKIEKNVNLLQTKLAKIDEELSNEELYLSSTDKYNSLANERCLLEKLLEKDEELWLIKCQEYETKIQEQ